MADNFPEPKRCLSPQVKRAHKVEEVIFSNIQQANKQSNFKRNLDITKWYLWLSERKFSKR